MFVTSSRNEFENVGSELEVERDMNMDMGAGTIAGAWSIGITGSKRSRRCGKML